MSETDFKKKILELEAQVDSLRKSRLGLVFEVKTEDVVEQSKVKLPVIKEDFKRRLFCGAGLTDNFMIEGDNYLALSVLNYTHKKTIDVIYIDPPYNTGSRDWKYNNDYVDSEDAYRHSKWLSMMKSRLILAKNLLKDDGVLICAIDKYEQAHLGVLLEGIFLDFEIHCITIIHNPRGVQGKNFSYNHEYAFFLFRKGLQVIGTVDRDEELEEELRDHGGESLRTDARNCFYPILEKNGKIIGFGDVPESNFHPKSKNTINKDGITEVWPIDVKGIERKWVFARDTVEDIRDNLFIVKKKNGLVDVFRRKDTQKPRTVWNKKKHDASTFGSKIVNALTGSNFPFPKSLYNTQDCLKCVIKDKKNAIVLDFFSGSGTTAHAVMLMNKEDGGNRRFIACTNNENKIAEEVCYPRISAVIKGHPDFKEITDIPSNLYYYKTDLVDINQISRVSDEEKLKITLHTGEMIAMREDVLNLVEANTWWQIFERNNKIVAIYFKEDKVKISELLSKLEAKNIPTVLYIFSWGKNEYRGEYSSAKIRIEDIPEPIIEVYREINSL